MSKLARMVGAVLCAAAMGVGSAALLRPPAVTAQGPPPVCYEDRYCSGASGECTDDWPSTCYKDDNGSPICTTC